MRQKFDPTPVAAEKLVRDIRRATRKQYSAEEKIRIVLEACAAKSSIAELCRRETIAESLLEQSRNQVHDPSLAVEGMGAKLVQTVEIAAKDLNERKDTVLCHPPPSSSRPRPLTVRVIQSHPKRISRPVVRRLRRRTPYTYKQ
jgi:transposase-like protein